MLLSIVTINYNNESGLEKTIQSVINQTNKDFEYIVVDGGSTDGSIELIKKHSDKITFWLSEKDKGVYDAMNKGISNSSGNYLLMLNSGDYLVDSHVIKKVFDNVSINNYDIIYGNVIWETAGFLENQSFPNKLSFKYFWKHSLGHQSALIKKELHDKYGLYDDTLKISSDWKFFILSICKYGASYHHIDFPISVCERNGISCDPNSLVQIFEERNEVFNKYFSMYSPDYIEADGLSQELNELKNSSWSKLNKKLSSWIKKYDS